MGKTRSCRRTEDENKIHDKAVKMRKMTDEQLVHYVEDRVEKARSEGFNQGKKAALINKEQDCIVHQALKVGENNESKRIFTSNRNTSDQD